MSNNSLEPRITIAEFEQLTAATLPIKAAMGIITEEIGYGQARMRLPAKAGLLRPGGTIAGPALMTLADVLMFAVILGMIGRVEMAVTTNLNCNFLRPPKPIDVIGEGKIIKLGRRLAVGEVSMFCEEEPAEPIAHATVTYSIPLYT